MSRSRPSDASAGLRLARKVAVGVIGCTVLLVGLALIAVPGPTSLIAIFGLAILASEFIWARRLLGRVRKGIKEGTEALKGGTEAWFGRRRRK
jgi:hypothetical protein